MDKIDIVSPKETPGASNYNADAITQYFDEYGIHEWERLVQTPAGQVNLYIHTYYLEKHISKGMRILEIGAGAGRFTQVLARLGTQILVADLSRVQLDLNNQFANELGFKDAVMDWQQTDICDLSRFEPVSFDCIVVYGGPFSYVLDQRDLALAECLRVLRPGGLLFLSVMSLWGTAHRHLDGVLALPVSVNQKITGSGDITSSILPERKGSFMHMFRANELKEWLEQKDLTILDLSASNCISLTWDEMLAEVRDDAEKWNELLRMELEACAEGGCLDMGTHIVAVVRKGSRKSDE